MASINKKLEFVLDLQSHRFNAAVRQAQKRINHLAGEYEGVGSRFGKTRRNIQQGVDSISTQLARAQKFCKLDSDLIFDLPLFFECISLNDAMINGDMDEIGNRFGI